MTQEEVLTYLKNAWPKWVLKQVIPKSLGITMRCVEVSFARLKEQGLIQKQRVGFPVKVYYKYIKK